jgi:DNA sulfur modification protein DndC
MLVNLEDNVYKVFDEALTKYSKIVLAYSGGKDSTVLAILFYKWLMLRNIKGLNVVLLHNDTLSEINPMEMWARHFMNEYSKRLSLIGNNVEIRIIVPDAIDTFYWRVFVRGYPAPTYNFRWCVNLLKMKPAKRSLHDDDAVLLTGIRESESSTRAGIVKRSYGSCPLGPSKCLAYYLQINESNITKISPLRDWQTADVFEYLRHERDFDVSELLRLYDCDGARFGCWHCTLATVQWGLQVLSNNYLYFDMLRLIYRRISDIPELRLRKSTGYSKLGALNHIARSIIFHAINIAEELSNIKLYGLDEIKVHNITLRELFYKINAKEANKIIKTIDNTDKFISIEKIRKLDNSALLFIDMIDKMSIKDKSRILALKRGFDPMKEILQELKERTKQNDIIT